MRGTGRIDVANRVLEAIRILALAGRQVLHGLRVVVGVPSITISVVADLISLLLARKLYDGNPMLLGRICNALVLRGDGVNKGIGGRL